MGDFDGHPFRGNQWATLYHGTTASAVDSIMKRGVEPRNGAAWASDSEEIARQFALAKTDGVVLEVRVPEGSFDRIDPLLGLPLPPGVAPRGDLRAAFREGIKPEWVIGVKAPQASPAGVTVSKGDYKAGGQMRHKDTPGALRAKYGAAYGKQRSVTPITEAQREAIAAKGRS